MNKIDDVKVTMDTVICEFFDKNSAETSKLPNCTLILNTIKANDRQITAYKSQKAALGKSVTQQKDNAHQVLAEIIITHIRRFGAYIALKNDKQLQAALGFKAYLVPKAKDSKLIEYATVLLVKGREMITQLAEVGINSADLDDLSDALEAFKATVPLPRVDDATVTQLNHEIKRLIKENDRLKAQIDAIMEVARETNKAFYDSYRSLRRAGKPMVTHIALSVNVTDSQTAEPISGVTISVTSQHSNAKGGAKPLKRKSAEKGGIRIKNLVEGVYTLVVSKLGYREQTLTINILSGETTTVAIKLDRA